MRKVWVVTVAMTCVCVFGIMPSASAQIIVNFDTYFSDPVLALVGYSLTSDNDGDGMVDADAYALISYILADTGQPTYGAVSAAWTTNLASLAPVQAAVAAVYGPAAGTAVQNILAGGLTRGDNAYVLAALTGLTLGALMPPAPVSAGSAVGTTGDPDGDGLTNLQEYNNAGGVRAQFITNALTKAPLAISTHPTGGVITEGQNITFTVAATGGVVPYSYQWKKDGTTNVGTDSPSYTITGAVIGDSGSYTCTVTDSDSPTPASVTSNAAVLSVLAATLPAASIYGLIVLGLLCVGAGVFVLRRVAHR